MPTEKGSQGPADAAPRYGDQVEHPAFGLCDVMVVRDNRMKIRQVGAAGQLKEIALGVFRPLPPELRDGKRVFKLVKIE